MVVHGRVKGVFDWLLAYLNRVFPDVPECRLEDAAADAVEIIVFKKLQIINKIYINSVQKFGDERAQNIIKCYCKTIARRRVTGMNRRAATRMELLMLPDDVVEPSVFPGQEHAVMLHELVEKIIPEYAARMAPRKLEALGAALTDRMVRGGTDKSVALVHGVPRETLNRTKNALFDSFSMEEHRRVDAQGAAADPSGRISMTQRGGRVPSPGGDGARREVSDAPLLEAHRERNAGKASSSEEASERLAKSASGDGCPPGAVGPRGDDRVENRAPRGSSPRKGAPSTDDSDND